MDGAPIPILCVAGTGPSVGKTVLTAALMRRAIALGGHPVGIVPASTGCEYGDDHDLVSEDGDVLREAAGRPIPPLVAAPYRFATATSPLLAARRAGLSLQLEQLVEAVHVAREHGDVVFVELPYGAMSPIAEDGCGLDLAARLGARIIILAQPEDGVESRVLSLLECARARGLEVGGVMFHAPPPEPFFIRDFETSIADFGRVHVFPALPTLAGNPIEGATAHLLEHRVLERAFGPPEEQRAELR
jgi:dethiobiotin synthetase